MATITAVRTTTSSKSTSPNYVHALESRIRELENEVTDLVQGGAAGQPRARSLSSGAAGTQPVLTRDALKKMLIRKLSNGAALTGAALSKVAEEPVVESTESQTSLPTTEEGINELAEQIIDIIGQYGRHVGHEEEQEAGAHKTWAGKGMFVKGVADQIKANQPIKMILPAFPWKSVNRVEKVTGNLPDLGEALALSRLNNICEDVKSVYPLGGEVHLATDGMLFDDLVGISDKDTWDYSTRLMEIAAENGFDGIKLLRVMDILKLLPEGEPLTEEKYYSLVKQCRDTLLSPEFARGEDEVRKMMKEDEDTMATYRGFIRFLESDLKFSPVSQSAKAQSGQAYRRFVKKVAIGMMIRAESFTNLLLSKCPGFVRLSIHPSSGQVKLSVPLIVQRDGNFPRTPWHSSPSMDITGAIYMDAAKNFRETHNLVYHQGRPYYFRERNDLWDWENDDVEFEPKYPNELHVYPTKGARDLLPEEQEKLQKLSQIFQGPLKISGFTNC